nr:hypothetical protein [Natronolimnobius sp. AArcel1]
MVSDDRSAAAVRTDHSRDGNGTAGGVAAGESRRVGGVDDRLARGRDLGRPMVIGSSSVVIHWILGDCRLCLESDLGGRD